MQIKPVNLKQDLSAILRQEKSIFNQDAFGIEDFAYYYLIGRETFLVAYLEDRFVGYICAYQQQTIAYIASIAVDTSVRRQGIGRTLLSQIVDYYLSQNAVSQIILHVRQSNQGAIQLYQAFGFEIVATETNYYPDEDAYRMHLKLASRRDNR